MDPLPDLAVCTLGAIFFDVGPAVGKRLLTITLSRRGSDLQYSNERLNNGQSFEDNSNHGMRMSGLNRGSKGKDHNKSRDCEQNTQNLRNRRD